MPTSDIYQRIRDADQAFAGVKARAKGQGWRRRNQGGPVA
jgi:hypothetical protein